jgi:hypothetical protein
MGTVSATLDPRNYTVFRHVAVLDSGFELQVPGENEGEVEFFQVTPEFLAQVCDNGNRREAETGDLCPVIIGRHTKKDAPEHSQPEIVGYARNWHLAPLLNTDRPAAHVDFWIRNQDVERVKKFPRRSAEIWRGRAEIDPISLLGATTPHRDLGMLTLSRPERSIHLSRDNDMPADITPKGDQPVDTPEGEDTNSLLRKLVATVTDLSTKFDTFANGGSGGDGNTAQAGAPGADAAAGGAPGGDQMSDQDIEALIAQLEQSGGAGAPGAAGPPGAGGPPPGAPAGPAAPGGEGPPVDRKEDKPAQAMAYAGGQNTFTPGLAGGKEPAKLDRQDEVVLQLQRERDELKLKLARQDVESKLKKLVEAKSLLMDEKDFNEEVDDILAFPEDRRQARLERIEKNYPRDITRLTLPAVGASQEVRGGNSGATQAEVEQVVQLARTEKLSYDAAFRKQFGRFPWEKAK